VYLSCNLLAERGLMSVLGVAMDGCVPLGPDFKEESPYCDDHSHEPSDTCVLWIFAACLSKVPVL
jgi:hypothetical protein